MSAHVYNKQDNGKTIEVAANSTVTVKLAGNPTTGYAWHRAGYSKKENANCEHSDVDVKYHAPAAGVMGAGGEYEITIKPKKAGDHSVHLIYCRAFEGEKDTDEKYVLHMKVSA